MSKKTLPKSYNPLYLSLKEQIATENVIFKQKNDFYTTALTLTAEDAFKHSYIKESLRELIGNIRPLIADSDSLTYFKESGLIVSLSQKYKVSGTNEIKKYLEKCLVSIATTNTPPQILGSVGYFLKLNSAQLNNFSQFQSSMADKLSTYIASGNINAAIDISIGLSVLTTNQADWIKQRSIEKLNSLAIERISKLVILFTGDPIYIEKLEESLSNSIGSSTYPDIGFSIFEAQKIINSNIPDTSLKNILTELKRVDPSWSKMIANMEAEGITIDVTQLHKIPNFSPHQDVWSLFGLSISGRSKTVQVSETDYKDYLDYSSKTKNTYKKVNVISLLSILVITILQTIYVYFLFDTRSVGFQETLKNLSIQNCFLDLNSTYFIFINPWLQLGVALIWIPVLTSRLVLKGHLTFVSIILSWPILLPFYEIAKKIKSRISE